MYYLNYLLSYDEIKSRKELIESFSGIEVSPEKDL